jgi:hypothetical protein
MDCVTVGEEHPWGELVECLGHVMCARGAGSSMMESEVGPLDPASAAALVARVLDDLRRRSEQERMVLLSDLLCAAWPTCWAQDQ